MSSSASRQSEQLARWNAGWQGKFESSGPHSSFFRRLGDLLLQNAVDGVMREYPVVQGTPVDLYALMVFVVNLEGVQSVDKLGGWGSILQALHIRYAPSEFQNTVTQIKHIFATFCQPFEYLLSEHVPTIEAPSEPAPAKPLPTPSAPKPPVQQPTTPATPAPTASPITSIPRRDQKVKKFKFKRRAKRVLVWSKAEDEALKQGFQMLGSSWKGIREHPVFGKYLGPDKMPMDLSNRYRGFLKHGGETLAAPTMSLEQLRARYEVHPDHAKYDPRVRLQAVRYPVSSKLSYEKADPPMAAESESGEETPPAPVTRNPDPWAPPPVEDRKPEPDPVSEEEEDPPVVASGTEPHVSYIRPRLYDPRARQPVKVTADHPVYPLNLLPYVRRAPFEAYEPSVISLTDGRQELKLPVPMIPERSRMFHLAGDQKHIKHDLVGYQRAVAAKRDASPNGDDALFNGSSSSNGAVGNSDSTPSGTGASASNPTHSGPAPQANNPAGGGLGTTDGTGAPDPSHVTASTFSSAPSAAPASRVAGQNDQKSNHVNGTSPHSSHPVKGWGLPTSSPGVSGGQSPSWVYDAYHTPFKMVDPQDPPGVYRTKFAASRTASRRSYMKRYQARRSISKGICFGPLSADTNSSAFRGVFRSVLAGLLMDEPPSESSGDEVEAQLHGWAQQRIGEFRRIIEDGGAEEEPASSASELSVSEPSASASDSDSDWMTDGRRRKQKRGRAAQKKKKGNRGRANKRKRAARKGKRGFDKRKMKLPKALRVWVEKASTDSDYQFYVRHKHYEMQLCDFSSLADDPGTGGRVLGPQGQVPPPGQHKAAGSRGPQRRVAGIPSELGSSPKKPSGGRTRSSPAARQPVSTASVLSGPLASELKSPEDFDRVRRGKDALPVNMPSFVSMPLRKLKHFLKYRLNMADEGIFELIKRAATARSPTDAMLQLSDGVHMYLESEHEERVRARASEYMIRRTVAKYKHTPLPLDWFPTYSSAMLGNPLSKMELVLHSRGLSFGSLDLAHRPRGSSSGYQVFVSARDRLTGARPWSAQRDCKRYAGDNDRGSLWQCLLRELAAGQKPAGSKEQEDGVTAKPDGGQGDSTAPVAMAGVSSGPAAYGSSSVTAPNNDNNNRNNVSAPSATSAAPNQTGDDNSAASEKTWYPHLIGSWRERLEAMVQNTRIMYSLLNKMDGADVTHTRGGAYTPMVPLWKWYQRFRHPELLTGTRFNFASLVQRPEVEQVFEQHALLDKDVFWMPVTEHPVLFVPIMCTCVPEIPEPTAETTDATATTEASAQPDGVKVEVPQQHPTPSQTAAAPSQDAVMASGTGGASNNAGSVTDNKATGSNDGSVAVKEEPAAVPDAQSNQSGAVPMVTGAADSSQSATGGGDEGSEVVAVADLKTTGDGDVTMGVAGASTTDTKPSDTSNDQSTDKPADKPTNPVSDSSSADASDDKKTPPHRHSLFKCVLHPRFLEHGDRTLTSSVSLPTPVSPVALALGVPELAWLVTMYESVYGPRVLVGGPGVAVDGKGKHGKKSKKKKKKKKKKKRKKKHKRDDKPKDKESTGPAAKVRKVGRSTAVKKGKVLSKKQLWESKGPIVMHLMPDVEGYMLASLTGITSTEEALNSLRLNAQRGTLSDSSDDSSGEEEDESPMQDSEDDDSSDDSEPLQGAVIGGQSLPTELVAQLEKTQDGFRLQSVQGCTVGELTLGKLRGKE